MSLMDLIERYVIAHERLAASNEVLAQAAAAKLINSMHDGTTAGPFQPGTSDGTECTAGGGERAGEGLGYAPPPPAQEPPQTQTASTAGWDPYAGPVVRQYRAEKQAILKAELAKFGIDPGAKMTGAQMHELLLEKAKEAAATTAAAVPPAAPAGFMMAMQGGQPAAPPVPQAPSMAPPLVAGQVYEAPVLDDATNQPVTVRFHAALDDSEIGMNQVRAALKLICASGGDAPTKAAGVIQNIGGASRLTDAATGQRLIADTAIVPIYRGLMDVLEGRG